MAQRGAHFIRGGVPNGGDAWQWRPYRGTARRCLWLTWWLSRWLCRRGRGVRLGCGEGLQGRKRLALVAISATIATSVTQTAIRHPIRRHSLATIRHLSRSSFNGDDLGHRPQRRRPLHCRRPHTRCSSWRRRALSPHTLQLALQACADTRGACEHRGARAARSGACKAHLAHTGGWDASVRALRAGWRGVRR